VYGLEVALGLHLEQGRAVLVLALLHPVAVDVEGRRVDVAPVDLESVRVLEQVERLYRLLAVLQSLQARDDHRHLDVDFECLPGQELALDLGLLKEIAKGSAGNSDSEGSACYFSFFQRLDRTNLDKNNFIKMILFSVTEQLRNGSTKKRKFKIKR